MGPPMIDSFVLFAPIFLLGVIALLGFVGCGFTSGTLSGDPIPGPVLRCTADDHTVELNWDPVTDATEYHVKRSETMGGPHDPIGDPVLAPSAIFHDPGLTNGKHYYYVVSATVVAGMAPPEETTDSNEVDALPLGPFVTDVIEGLANATGRDGWFGTIIKVGLANVTIFTLGRGRTLGISTAHDIKVFDALTKEELGNASVDMNSPAVGDFRYGKLIPADPATQHLTLAAGQRCYIVSQEFTGGDPFYEQNTTVTTTTVASVEQAIYRDSTGTFTTAGGTGGTYGPVSFQY
jgi:hypothetical protein